MKVPSAIKSFYEQPIKAGSDGKMYDSLGGTALMPTEAMELYSLVKRFKPRACVEVGTGLGASAVAICAAMDEEGSGFLWTLDPFQERFGNVGISELERLGFQKICEFQPMFAEDFFQEARKSSKSFEMIFQDGAHSVGPKMTHVFLAARVLEPGGVLALHDVTKACTVACVTYLVKEQGYKVIPLKPASRLKRLLRRVKYSFKYGPWYGNKIIPFAHLNLIALQKPSL